MEYKKSVNFPINNTLIVAFLLHYYKAPTYVWIIMVIVYMILWITRIIKYLKKDSIDSVVARINPNNSHTHLTFEKRIPDTIHQQHVLKAELTEKK